MVYLIKYLKWWRYFWAVNVPENKVKLFILKIYLFRFSWWFAIFQAMSKKFKWKVNKRLMVLETEISFCQIFVIIALHYSNNNMRTLPKIEFEQLMWEIPELWKQVPLYRHISMKWSHLKHNFHWNIVQCSYCNLQTVFYLW